MCMQLFHYFYLVIIVNFCPQAAGYTLNELLSLCRSTVLQQRTFSLQLLAKVIQRARHNEYSSVKSGSRDKCEDGDSVLEQLLASDVPLLLRYSLDENVSSVMFAAAAGLHSLLVIPPENVSYLGWCNIEIFSILLHAGIVGGIHALLFWMCFAGFEVT